MSRGADVEVGGYRVRILVDGDTGPVVVLCSGLGGRALHWRDTAADLAADHTVVRFDRPGTPVTGAPRSPTVRGEADRIAAVLDAVRCADKAVVVGHSVGGFYAEAFARLYPQRTRALVLLDSSVAAEDRRLRLPLRAKVTVADAAAKALRDLHLREPLTRAGLALAQRRRPDGLDAQMRDEINSAAIDSAFLSALFTEYVGYHELAAELYHLRPGNPLPPVPRVVATAHTGRRTRRWLTQQIGLAETLGAEHVTISPAGHLVMIERPHSSADLIRSVASRA
ncbi:alpha/beta fold hydrolase [Mycobacterium paragordonae]|uniref:3-oxoadipate enol-lactonase n=1 Tax=Mycobacterium paragordonae TaxID=1389713 RepID=A0ABQ1C8J6_9MYCO|nr:alpha/beta hydrolase [Mycobacterium paragordonae]GFG80771.1 3-oxoadipate enol-lactonase [Mycobacterium paragordonae]